LSDAKIPEIIRHIQDQTIIYTEYVTDIIEKLSKAVKAAGYSYALYTGSDHSGLKTLLASKQSFDHKFATAGEFAYFCQLHPDMVGEVKVMSENKNSGEQGTATPSINNRNSAIPVSPTPSEEQPSPSEPSSVIPTPEQPRGAVRQIVQERQIQALRMDFKEE
jgi:hypothetical protein